MKKKYALKACLLVTLLIVYLSVIFKIVNYSLPEFKLSIKTVLRQELTLEEMKGTSIYKVYNQIDHDTNVEEINDILNKKSKNLYEWFESWHYPYGYLSVWVKKDEEPGVLGKVVSFEAPYTIKLTEEKLYNVFECDSLEEIVAILGEPAILGETYDTDGKTTDSHYEWGIRTSLSEKFIDDIKNKYGEYISFPLRHSSPINFMKSMERKLCLRVSIKADNSIESFSLEDNGKRL